MKINFRLNNDEYQSNIGIAKALTEVPNMTEADLYEIGRYLLVYSDARATENNLSFFGYESQKAVTV